MWDNGALEIKTCVFFRLHPQSIIKMANPQVKKYDTKGMKETCLNCGKKSCNLAGVGNIAKINENDGCWIPQKNNNKTK